MQFAGRQGMELIKSSSLNIAHEVTPVLSLPHLKSKKWYYCAFRSSVITYDAVHLNGGELSLRTRQIRVPYSTSSLQPRAGKLGPAAITLN